MLVSTWLCLYVLERIGKGLLSRSHGQVSTRLLCHASPELERGPNQFKALEKSKSFHCQPSCSASPSWVSHSWYHESTWAFLLLDGWKILLIWMDWNSWLICCPIYTRKRICKSTFSLALSLLSHLKLGSLSINYFALAHNVMDSFVHRAVTDIEMEHEIIIAFRAYMNNGVWNTRVGIESTIIIFLFLSHFLIANFLFPIFYF